jgi:hypothetical protein
MTTLTKTKTAVLLNNVDRINSVALTTVNVFQLKGIVTGNKV